MTVAFVSGFRAACAGAALFVFSSGPAALAGEGALVREADDPALTWGPCPDFMPEGCGIAVLQGDPAKPNADIFFRLRGGTTAPRHWHRSAERMALVSGELRVEYDGESPKTARAGAYLYGPAEKPHIAACVSAEDCVLFVAFEAPVDALPGGRGEE